MASAEFLHSNASALGSPRASLLDVASFHPHLALTWLLSYPVHCSSAFSRWSPHVLVTGTLTEQGLDLQGIVPIVDGRLHNMVGQISLLPTQLVELLASCHGLARMGESLVGDPLDQARRVLHGVIGLTGHGPARGKGIPSWARARLLGWLGTAGFMPVNCMCLHLLRPHRSCLSQHTGTSLTSGPRWMGPMAVHTAAALAVLGPSRPTSTATYRDRARARRRPHRQRRRPPALVAACRPTCVRLAPCM